MTELSKEYGTAIFMLACESGQQKNYGKALESVCDIFAQNPDYLNLLSSPAVPLKERLNLIETAFAGTLPDHVLSYLLLLCEKGRLSCFTESADEYKALLNASEHVYSAEITSAVALTDNEKEKLTDKLQTVYNGKITAEYFIDAELIGGVIVKIDGKIMDGSLRRRLHDIKEVVNT